MDQDNVVDDDNYPKLGDFQFSDRCPADYLPSWIEDATPISGDVLSDRIPIDDGGSGTGGTKATEPSSFSLCEPVLDGLRRGGITDWFPVQATLIPELAGPSGPLPPRDLCVSAPTGSGKTLAYVVPIVDALVRQAPSHEKGRIRALIVVPVVDLARQVCRVFEWFAPGSGLKVVALTGQRDLDSEADGLYGGSSGAGRMMTMTMAVADVIVATPGRLIEHLAHGGGALRLDRLRFLIIDEADRLLADHRIDWFRAVERAVYGDGHWDDGASTGTGNNSSKNWFFGQKVPAPGAGSAGAHGSTIRRYRPNVGGAAALFAAGRYPLRKVFLSATLSYDPGQLQRMNLFRPKLFRAATAEDQDQARRSNQQQSVTMPASLDQFYVKCSSKLKPLVLYQLLKERKTVWDRVLVFVRSRATSDRLAFLLARMMGAEERTVAQLTAGLTRIRRLRMIEKFAKGKIGVVICSDVLARGIDVPGVACVVNYDPPDRMLAYVHRAGRTARAGQKGTVVTVASNEQVDEFQKLMETADRWSGITLMDTPDPKPAMAEYRAALDALKMEIQKRPSRGAVARTRRMVSRRKHILLKKTTRDGNTGDQKPKGS